MQTAFRDFPEIRKVILFGSRAMGNHKQGSDVDLAVQHTSNKDIISSLSSRLNQELPIPFKMDVIDYDTIANKNLLDHIKEHGVVIYEK
jgi:predicted nucleotidyltransferase